MKKKLYAIVIIIFAFCAIFFTFCTSISERKLKIASISTRNDGVIKPVDIYLIRDGYIANSTEEVQAVALDKYFVQYYKKTKQTTSSSPDGMTIPGLKPDIINWKYLYKDWKTVYFYKTLEYSYTIHIDLIEKKSSYQITYYFISDLIYPSNSIFGYKNELCFSNPPKKELSQYKRIEEFPKSEIISITYIS